MTLATACISCFTSNEMSGATIALTFLHQSSIVLVATRVAPHVDCVSTLRVPYTRRVCLLEYWRTRSNSRARQMPTSIRSIPIVRPAKNSAPVR